MFRQFHFTKVEVSPFNTKMSFGQCYPEIVLLDSKRYKAQKYNSQTIAYMTNLHGKRQ